MKNLKKLLASALLVCMLVSMLPVSALAESEACAHSETYVETVSPGCTTEGSNTIKCSACGATISSTVIPATGVHTAGEPVTVAATCTAEGSTTVSCTVCGGVLSTGVIQALGHSYGEAVTKAATCTEVGVKTFTCSHCGDSYNAEISALGHSFSDASCTAPKTCAVCGATEGAALGHSFSDATCTAPKTCKVCTATEGEPLGHTAGEETVITKATCIDEGSKSVKCTVCDETYTVVIPATGHTAGEETVITETTCIDEGSKSVNCTVCGETYTVIIPATGAHIEGAHTVTKEATCDEAGEETISCATEGCEYSETMEIPALGHKYNEQHECSVCGKKELPMKNAPTSNTFIITGDKIVHVGENITLSAVNGENNSVPVTWSSINPDVATVEDSSTGVVKGVAKGKATITATANDGSGVSASIDVYVQEGTTPYIYVEKSEINIGETAKVRLVYAGDNAPATVTWSVYPTTIATITPDSSDPLEATVTGIAAGYVSTISATYGTGNQSVNAGNAIFVKSPITGISISGLDSVITGEKITLTATVTPADATDKTVTWSSSDPTIATVDEKGVVTGLKAADKVTITATSKADTTKSASKEITVKAPDLTVSGPGTVAVGKTITLTAKVGPDEVTDKTVTWKSSDETIATVDKDGKVTGKKAGDVKITAASNAYENLTVEVPVKVTAAVYLYYGNGSHFNGIHPMPFVSSDLWAGGVGVNVIINGVPLVPGRDFSCYSSPHGMIGVTVNPGLLRLLPQNAWHSIEIVSANGVAAGSFSTGYFGYYNIYGVKTGDDSTPLLWAALCLLGISGAGIILAKSRKRKA